TPFRPRWTELKGWCVAHSSRALGRRRVSLPVALLAALVAIAVALRATAALALPAPFLFPDEGAYALLGRDLWHHGDLAVLGGPSQYVSALYPLVSALPYGVLRVLQVLALWATWAAAAAFCVAWLALGGGSPLRSLGGYGAGHYSVHGVVILVLEHAGELVLVCGVLPLCAAILLAFQRPLDLPTRATAVF